MNTLSVDWISNYLLCDLHLPRTGLVSEQSLARAVAHDNFDVSTILLMEADVMENPDTHLKIRKRLDTRFLATNVPNAVSPSSPFPTIC